jgi:aryl-alcohol dehydrogenase-like predicted oxidoreductase
MNLNTYFSLGRSGFKISPFCLGTMTFGTEWGWGNDEGNSKAIFDHYVDAGGNFVDTANG